MSREVLFEPAASRELNEAAGFYDLEQPGLGTAFLDAVEAALLTVVDRTVDTVTGERTPDWITPDGIDLGRPPLEPVVRRILDEDEHAFRSTCTVLGE